MRLVGLYNTEYSYSDSYIKNIVAKKNLLILILCKSIAY